MSLLSVKEAATILKLSDQTVRDLCNKNILPGDKVGKSWVLRKDDVTKFSKISHYSDRPLTKKIPKDKPIFLSFFSGAMGLDIGLEKAGLECLLACEVDKHCRKTIIDNNNDIALIGDIRNYSSKDIMGAIGLELGDEIDVICGGPPCQAFSTAGKRKSFEDERGNVFLKFIDVATEIKPKFIVIENVRGLLSAPLKHRPHDQRGKDHRPLSEEEQKGGALRHILQQIKKSGYKYSFELYNSAVFGVPQVRERVVIICSRDGEAPPLLEPTHSSNDQDGLHSFISFADACNEAKLADVKHTHISFPEKRLKYFRLLKDGQNWKCLPEDLQKEAMGKSYFSGGGKSGFLRRVSSNKPSPTLVTHPAMPATDLCHPTEDRPLSIEEYKTIQQFPKSWNISGSLIEQYKQIGNAVPTGLGHAIGKHIIKLLKGKEIKTFPDFKYSRYKNTSHLDWK